MLVLRKKINKSNVKFLCVSGNTSSGFYHRVKFYVNDSLKGESKINYYNRTWETFTYQTACNSALNVAYNDIYNDYIKRYKNELNKNRISQKEKDYIRVEMEKNNSIIQTILKAKKIIKKSNNANEFKKEYFNI